MAARINFVPSSKLERLVHWGVWLPCVALPFWYTYQLSNTYLYQLHQGFFDSEVSLFDGRLKDISDGEWTFWRQFFSFYAVVSVLSSIICGLTSNRSILSRKISLITVSFIALSMLLSVKGLLVLLGHALVVYVIAQSRSKIVIWGCLLSATFAINFEPFQGYIISLLPKNDTTQSLVIYSMMMCNLRHLSFALELASVRIGGSESSTKRISVTTPNIIDFLAFIFYFPLFLNGPIVTFDKFNAQMINRIQRPPIAALLIQVISCLLYFALIEISFHFLYSASISKHIHILVELNCMETLGIIWTQLHLFYVKYVVFYRFAGVFAQLDGIEPPGQPGCITNLYTYVDMWRYFDKGLYAFLSRYIYIPIGGSRCGVTRQILGSFCSFAFVGFWHGGTEKYFAWALTNWLGVSVEAMVTKLMKTESIQRFKARIGPRMHRRISAAFGAVEVGLLILSNMLFLSGVEATTVYLQRLFIFGWPLCPLLLLPALYCAVNCIIDARS